MSISMYMCVYVCVCLYVYMCICLSLSLYLFLSLSLSFSVSLCLSVCLSFSLYIYKLILAVYIEFQFFNYFNKKFLDRISNGGVSSRTFSMQLSANGFDRFIVFQKGVLSGIFRGVLNTTLFQLTIFCFSFLYLGMFHYSLLANTFGGGLYCVETR